MFYLCPKIRAERENLDLRAAALESADIKTNLAPVPYDRLLHIKNGPATWHFRRGAMPECAPSM
jgi:hypothetical protein